MGHTQSDAAIDTNSAGKVKRMIAAEVPSVTWSDPIMLALMAGAVVILLFGSSRTDHKLASWSVVLVIAGAALAVGGVVGFIFGIPRVVYDRKGTADASAQAARYEVNTNLEQISDWLTKIIVGLGLVQMTRIPRAFQSIATFTAQAFGSPAVSPAFTAAVLLYFGIVGFLSTYLWTRLLLTLAFLKADGTGTAQTPGPDIYEGLVQALLYQPAPDGFTTAIEAGQEFTRAFGSDNWRVWRSLACAYGQQFAYLRAQGAAPENLESVRQRALEAVDHVLRIKPGEREGLRNLWDPGRTTDNENDLVAFYGDADFKARLMDAAPSGPAQ